jgi:hypothetical protein
LACHNRDIIGQDIYALSGIRFLFVSIGTGDDYDNDSGEKTTRRDESRQPDFGFDIF